MFKTTIYNLKNCFLKKNNIYIILIILFVFLFIVQTNIIPFERSPGWDEFWVDVRTAGKLFSLEHSLRAFELPIIDSYTNFGWNLAGDHHSFWNPLNFLILLFPPIIVIMFNQIFFSIVGGLGAYLFLKLITKNKFISFFGGLNYITVPFVINLLRYEQSSYIFYLIPLFLLLIHKICEKTTKKNLLFFILLTMLAVGSSDIYSPIVLFTVIFIYCFFIAHRYYHFPILKAFKKALLLIFLTVLVGSFYFIPVYSNFHTISDTLSSFKSANLLPLTYSGVSINFLSFFNKYGLESLYRPLDGSGLSLYIPVFLYLGILLAFIFYDIIFKRKSKQILVVCTLILLGLTMFLISVVFYNPIFLKIFSNVRENATGILRAHINLIPFVNLLAAFICFAAINQSKNKKIKIGIYSVIIVTSLLIDLSLFKWHFLPARPISSSNLIQLPVQDTFNFLPWLNIFPIILLIAYDFGKNLLQTKKIFYIILIIFAVFLPLLKISAYHEWQLLAVGRSPELINGYSERKSCIDKTIDRYNPNYRTLFTGKQKYPIADARNEALIAETELHTQNKEKILFSYREFEHPYTGLMRGSFYSSEKKLFLSNIMPPFAREVLKNLETTKLMGVKWIISADEEMNHSDLIYKGKCDSQQAEFFLYELINPLGVVFTVDNYKTVSLSESLKIISEKEKVPWINNIVYLETDQIENGQKNLYPDLENVAQITKEKFNSVEITTINPKEKYLILSYIYRPNWHAFIDSSETKIYRAYGGFMSIKIPAGQHLIKFKYYPRDVYLGILLTLIALLFPFVIKIKKE